MIDLKINQELNNFSSFNGIDEAFLPIFINKYLKLSNKLFLVLKDDKQLNEIESLISISNPNCKVLSARIISGTDKKTNSDIFFNIYFSEK